MSPIKHLKSYCDISLCVMHLLAIVPTPASVLKQSVIHVTFWPKIPHGLHTEGSVTADTVGLSYGVCQEILTVNLNVRRTAVKFVPRLSTND
jgi:hypothetical protein